MCNCLNILLTLYCLISSVNNSVQPTQLNMIHFFKKQYIFKLVLASFLLFGFTHYATAQNKTEMKNTINNLRVDLSRSDKINKSYKDSLAEAKGQIEFLNKKLQECDLKYNTIGFIKVENNYWDPADFKEIVTRKGDTLKQAKNEKEWQKYFIDSIPCYIKSPTNKGVEYSSGYMYNYWAVKTFSDWGPENKRIPTKKDYNDLITYLKATYFLNDSAKIADDEMATHLKATQNWPPFSHTNKTGLNLVPGGFYSNNGFADTRTNYWLAPDVSSTKIEAMSIAYLNNKISIFERERADNYGYLIRCVKK